MKQQDKNTTQDSSKKPATTTKKQEVSTSNKHSCAYCKKSFPSTTALGIHTNKEHLGQIKNDGIIKFLKKSMRKKA